MVEFKEDAVSPVIILQTSDFMLLKAHINRNIKIGIHSNRVSIIKQ